VPDGGRTALRAQPSASQPDRRARQRIARARETGTGARAVARDAATERNGRMTPSTGSGIDTAGVDTAGADTAGIERLSINQATIKRASLAEALAATSAAGVEAIGLWREPVNEVGLDTA